MYSAAYVVVRCLSVCLSSSCIVSKICLGHRWHKARDTRASNVSALATNVCKNFSAVAVLIVHTFKLSCQSTVFPVNKITIIDM